jgi:Tfp pilus assembly protein PilF
MEPRVTDPLYAQANLAYQSGNLAQAEALYRQILTLNPAHAEVRNNLGLTLLAIGRYDDALAALEEALAGAAGNPRLQGGVFGNMGLLHRTRLQNSPLMNAPAFARCIESAYRHMWRRWCAS